MPIIIQASNHANMCSFATHDYYSCAPTEDHSQKPANRRQHCCCEQPATAPATQRSTRTQHNARPQPMTPRNARAAPATQRSTTTDDAAQRSCSSRHTALASALAACALSDRLRDSPSRGRQLDEPILRTLPRLHHQTGSQCVLSPLGASCE